MPIYTIGHSNHDAERFLSLLWGTGITAIADVRSSPFSRRLPHFNRSHIEQTLPSCGIAYVYLGDALGGRPSDPNLYDAEGHVDYERVRATPVFQAALDRLLQGAVRYQIALLCAEEDPIHCHRGLMITPALVERGVSPLHVRKDGSLETTPELEARLLAESKLDSALEPDLFRPEPDADERRRVLAEAYRTIGRKKGFRRDNPPVE